MSVQSLIWPCIANQRSNSVCSTAIDYRSNDICVELVRSSSDEYSTRSYGPSWAHKPDFFSSQIRHASRGGSSCYKFRWSFDNIGQKFRSIHVDASFWPSYYATKGQLPPSFTKVCLELMMITHWYIVKNQILYFEFSFSYARNFDGFTQFMSILEPKESNCMKYYLVAQTLAHVDAS